MSKMTQAVNNQRRTGRSNAVENFMGGVSYTLNPIETLKLVTASSIFGEPQYYRNGEFAEMGIKDGYYNVDKLFAEYAVLKGDSYEGKTTSVVMEEVIDRALDFDFEATIKWALTLRTEYLMRLNPQVIMVRAAMHPNRQAFTVANPGVFASINDKVMSRGDEPASQLTYYLYRNGKKNNVPNILKRSWAGRINRMSAYEMHKYKNAGIGLIDTVRVCHASGALVDELMTTGTVQVEDSSNTWETMRSAGMSWRDILGKIKLGHMALLRNLRGIFAEIEDADFCRKILEDLKGGVLKGKQFPFRYMAAKNALENASGVHHMSLILDALEECMDIACDNMPKLKGKTMCLSDNSGSAWGTCTSEWGTMQAL